MKKLILRAYYAQPEEGSALWWAKNIGLMLIALAAYIIANIIENAL